MANTLLTAEQISSLAIQLLRRELVLVNTVATVPAGEMTGPHGGTVTVRVRSTRTANKRSRTDANNGTPITFSPVSETSVDVSLSHIYDAATLTEHDRTLDLEAFGNQVLEAQVEAVARAAEDELAAVMNGLTPEVSFAATASESDTKSVMQQIREQMTSANVPRGGRFFACAPDVFTRLLNVSDFVRFDAVGGGESSAIRTAQMGSIYGFTVVETPALDAGKAVAYVRDGFAFATAMPAEPGGGVDSAAITQGGIGIRAIRQYRADLLAEQSVLSTFAGAALVDGNRVVAVGTSAA